MLRPVPAYAYSDTPDYQVWAFLTLVAGIAASLIFLLLYLVNRRRRVLKAFLIGLFVSVSALLILVADSSITGILMLLILAACALIFNWWRNAVDEREWQRTMAEEAQKQELPEREEGQEKRRGPDRQD